jgi:CheY-like chemotaxis protein/class 3 adenylate cyclase
VKPPPRILVVDDTPANVRLLEAVLAPRGYEVVVAATGPEALESVAKDPPDLVLLDILMPGMDGYEVCRRLRADPATAHLPVIMITASESREKVRGLEAGADDFVAKPFDRAELLARVASLLRVKEYHDIIQGQAAALAEWNATLEARVAEQVGELERMGRLRRFLSPQLADLLVSSDDETVLQHHRRQVAVVFCDLRGSTAFSEAVEPEEFMTALAEFHQATGRLIDDFDATVGHFAGDGFMVFFNDPLPCDNPAEQAVRLAVAMREAMGEISQEWRRLGRDLGFGVGIAFGFATLGQVGFQARSDYTAVGRVVALASRLCDEASDGEILVSPQVRAAVESVVESERLPEMTLKGFQNPIAPYRVAGLKPGAPTT